MNSTTARATNASNEHRRADEDIATPPPVSAMLRLASNRVNRLCSIAELDSIRDVPVDHGLRDLQSLASQITVGIRIVNPHAVLRAARSSTRAAPEAVTRRAPWQ